MSINLPPRKKGKSSNPSKEEKESYFGWKNIVPKVMTAMQVILIIVLIALPSLYVLAGFNIRILDTSEFNFYSSGDGVGVNFTATIQNDYIISFPIHNINVEVSMKNDSDFEFFNAGLLNPIVIPRASITNVTFDLFSEIIGILDFETFYNQTIKDSVNIYIEAEISVYYDMLGFQAGLLNLTIPTIDFEEMWS